MLIIVYFFILLGFLSLFFNVSHIPGLAGQNIRFYENQDNRYIVGFVQLLVGILLYIYLKKTKKQKSSIEHTICPNCKQTYNYKDLKDGKCPTCKETNTIEIEQYYKDNPFKDEDEN